MNQTEMRIWINSEASLARSIMATRKMAESIGLPSNQVALVATAVSELARNILKYARQGEIILRPVSGITRPGIEVVAWDQGPGIESVAAAMCDHHSTGGTLGLGLPGVKRLMDDFEIQSEVGKGTRVTARKWK
ncbi:ATP-binding protein [Blastopirellula marina]|uniref:ATP-binding protein n=1 Tax=Blastopirellula marina TaxID=124 RepID=A0A2S8FMA7_9BACT|nr:ATP-binding protein [Blastopirellula marina]PQO32984.1 ATP-binding protein [Blastopirellula marina]PTL43151.1 ATP-binding protein [Blastopirellula marina]